MIAFLPLLLSDNHLSIVDLKGCAKRRRSVDNIRDRLLMDSLLAAEGKAATTDEAMKKVYEDASKQITAEQEVHARHILVETEDEARRSRMS